MSARTFSVLLCSSFLLGVSVDADDWPQFLGLHRNGTSAEKFLIREWPPTGPEVVWRTPLGVSMSSVVVSEGTAFTLFQNESELFLVALDADNGKEVWKTAFAKAYENAMGNGPRATPSVAGESIFVFTGEGILAAFNRQNGHSIWQQNVPVLLNGAASEYGMSCSPLIVDNLVVVHSGQENAAVAAFDSSSGQLVWKTATGKPGYSSPVLMDVAGKVQIVTLTAAGAFGIDHSTGTVLWDFPFPTEYDCNTACPVKTDAEHVLISAGENHGSVLLKIEQDGDSFRAVEAWSSIGKDSQLRAEWQTPVIHEGHLYALDNSGSAGPITNLVCIRLADLKTVWQKPRFGKSNLILADGKLFLTTMNGEIVIVQATPAAFKELSRVKLLETTRQAPSISNGRLYVRDDNEVVCLKVGLK